jgi:predicted nucleotidyltransferase
MSAASDPVLAGVVRRLVEAYSPERIYLFGSVVRGEAGPDSDYGIMARPMTRRRNGCEAGWRIGPCGELGRRRM